MRRYGSTDQETSNKIINDMFDAADGSPIRESTLMENVAALIVSLNPPRPIKKWAIARMVEEVAAWYLK